MATDERELTRRIARGVKAVQSQVPKAAVVVALSPDGDGGHDVILEVRASTLEQQPGEVCCPGGHVEPGENPDEAAVREACEELLLSPHQVRLLGGLGVVDGPGGLPLHVFAASLSGYTGTFSRGEVASVFAVPMDWLLSHEPTSYSVRYVPEPPADFPWERVEGGRGYGWRPRQESVPFFDTTPVVWGATARVLQLFARVMRAGGADGQRGA